MGERRNLKLTVEYDGTDFEGWQRQPAPARTVQRALEEAFEAITREPHVLMRGSGRTDSGVHARAQVANVITHTTIPCLGLLRAMNGTLPPDVAVVAVEDAAPAFDARRAARGKHYAYRLWTREARSPLFARTSWHLWTPLDVEAIRAAAPLLLGEHDFSSFRAADCQAKSPVRILRRVDVTTPTPSQLQLDFEGTAFLKNMVRILVGTLIEVGLGRRSPDELSAILAARDRTRAGRTAPPHGLTLERVAYEDPTGSAAPDQD